MTRFAYENLVAENMAFIDKHLPVSLERDHIESIIAWSVDALYKNYGCNNYKPADSNGVRIAELEKALRNIRDQPCFGGTTRLINEVLDEH